MADGKERPSAIVGLVACDAYQREKTHAAVKRAIDALGGISAFVKPGDRVLLKPNLLKANPPDDAVTTHPEIVRAVIRLVRGAGGRVLVGDSPGMGRLDKVARTAGILAVVNEEGAELVSFDDPVTVNAQGRFQHFEIARVAHEADVIINLPKLKTHGMVTMTGAVKNCFGCIPGNRKAQWHLNAGVDHDQFSRMLVELYALLAPKLTVMDAVVGMEGNGPGSGDPRRIGAIIAGQDAVAVDVVAAALISLSPVRLPVGRAAIELGIGAASLEDITVKGDELEPLIVRDFRLPASVHTEWPLPDWLRRTLKNALTNKPAIDHSICLQCGLCERHCPRKAISKGRTGLVIDYRNCIRCFCCQEFCPHRAIQVRKGWASGLLRS